MIKNDKDEYDFPDNMVFNPKVFSKTIKRDHVVLEVERGANCLKFSDIFDKESNKVSGYTPTQLV